MLDNTVVVYLSDGAETHLAAALSGRLWFGSPDPNLDRDMYRGPLAELLA